MKIGVLGTGMVGNTIATRLVGLGHDVLMGARSAENARAGAWAESVGGLGWRGTFADAAAFGEMAFNCTRGASSLEALASAGADRLDGKILIDVANILPPDDPGPIALGQQIQTAFPRTRVVKTLNTMNCAVMVDPRSVPGAHTVFMSGDDAGAKQATRELLESFGWRDIIDLGGIASARGMESYVTLWVSISRALGTMSFNVAVLR
jgi:8-hydroxy-5-deazaflavin:NADPH oxidoreductase